MFELVKVVHHFASKEGTAILQRRLINNDLCPLGLNALHYPLNSTLAEVVTIALHRQTENANDTLLFLACIETAIGIVVTGTFEDGIRDIVFTGAVALHDSSDEVFRNIIIISKQLLGVLR